MASDYRTYEDAVKDYLAQFGALLEIPEDASPTAKRGAGDVPIGSLVDRAEAIAGISSSMLELARPYLESDDPNQREGASVQMIAQSAGELQLASELLQFVADEKEGRAADVTTRAARGTALREAIGDLEKSMQTPISAGLAPVVAPIRAGARARPTTPDEARKALKEAVDLTTDAIVQRVNESGGRLAWDLVFQTEWAKIIEGVVLARAGISEKLDGIKEGASAIVTRALGAAEKTLLNVYDKILALLGKDVEDEARKKVKEWLDQVKEKGKIEVLETLIGELYQVEQFKQALGGWLNETTASLDKINETTSEVELLSDKFIALAGQTSSLGKAVGYAKVIPIPAVLVVVIALQLGLLTTLVYAGYDYIGYKQVNLLDITKGVAQVVQENLGIQG
jgi:gas vesicle protein